MWWQGPVNTTSTRERCPRLPWCSPEGAAGAICSSLMTVWHACIEVAYADNATCLNVLQNHGLLTAARDNYELYCFNTKQCVFGIIYLYDDISVGISRSHLFSIMNQGKYLYVIFCLTLESFWCMTMNIFFVFNWWHLFNLLRWKWLRAIN